MPYLQQTQSIVYQENGETLGRIDYSEPQDNVISATHTFVDPHLRGQGIAEKLLDQLAELAREKDWKIRPVCNYVVSAFQRFEKYRDVRL